MEFYTLQTLIQILAENLFLFRGNKWIQVILKLNIRNSFYQLLEIYSMWNSTLSNNLVHTESKVTNHKKHLLKVASVKSSIDNKSPWMPKHSLSKIKNKYDKVKMSNINIQNHSLLGRIFKISNGNNNLENGVPTCYTSHPKIYTVTKQQERQRSRQEINKQNRKILSKIQCAYSTYGKDIWGPQWKQITSYRNNLLKKQVTCADLSVLVRATSAKSHQSRPHSAFLAKSRYQ